MEHENSQKKIMVLLWRMARGYLPTRERFRSRGVQCTDHCVPIFKRSFVMQQANNVANLLTRTSLPYASFHCHDLIPYCIENDIMNEMS